jgi:hypothetical protein
MALRSDRHRIRPIAALALDAGTTIGPRCATIHVGQEDDSLRTQAGYPRGIARAADVDVIAALTTAADTKEPESPSFV